MKDSLMFGPSHPHHRDILRSDAMYAERNAPGRYNRIAYQAFGRGHLNTQLLRPGQEKPLYHTELLIAQALSL